MKQDHNEEIDMKDIKDVYRKIAASVSEPQSWSNDWRWAVVCSLCIYVIVLAFRLSFAGRWDHPELWVNGERILATHDAYFWLAKAKGVGLIKGYPFAEFAALLHDFLGVGLGTIGFWFPAVLSSLVGVACYLWGWMLAGRTAGIMAGLAGSLTPGFYFRSRLGYFDTDLFTLLMPLLVAGLLAYWASRHMKRFWFVGFDESDAGEPLKVRETLWTAFAFGLITRFAVMWHLDILNVSVLYFFMTIFMILINGQPGKRVWAFYGLMVYMLAAFPGASFGDLRLWPLSLVPFESWGLSHSFSVIVLAALLVLIFDYAQKRKVAILDNAWVCAVIFLTVIVASSIVQEPVTAIAQKISVYLSPSGNGEGLALSRPVFPSIVQSIIEAKHVAMSEILGRGAFASWLGWLALLSSVAVVLLRPAALFLFPLVVLQLASVKLGIRFSMFGGASLLVYLGVVLYWLMEIALRRLARKELIGLCAQVGLGVAFLVFCYSQYTRIPLTPVVTKAHAEGLVELGDQVPGDSMVWTWWDWGYATQYYAGLNTVSDGGKHDGRDIFPVALALSTSSPLQANQIIREAAQHPPLGKHVKGYDIAAWWDTLPAGEVVEGIESLKTVEKTYPVKANQYLVVTWKDLTISKWISYYGNWNLQTGKTRKAMVRLYDPGELGFNIQMGATQNRYGQGGLVSDIDILDWGKVSKRHYAMNAVSMKLVPETPYLFINKVTRQSILVDKTANSSMLFRLLTGDPDDPEISKYFKLVVDKLPFVRIYEVVQG